MLGVCLSGYQSTGGMLLASLFYRLSRSLLKLRVAQSEVFFLTNSCSGSISDAIDVLSEVNNTHSLHITLPLPYSLMLSCNKSVISALQRSQAFICRLWRLYYQWLPFWKRLVVQSRKARDSKRLTIGLVDYRIQSDAEGEHWVIFWVVDSNEPWMGFSDLS